MRLWIGITLAMLCSAPLLGAAQPRLTHLLAWETTALPGVFEVEQCENKPHGCVFTLVVTLPGSARDWETGPLHRQRSWCWRVRPVASGGPLPWSNIVCS